MEFVSSPRVAVSFPAGSLLPPRPEINCSYQTARGCAQGILGPMKTSYWQVSRLMTGWRLFGRNSLKRGGEFGRSSGRGGFVCPDRPTLCQQLGSVRGAGDCTVRHLSLSANGLSDADVLCLARCLPLCSSLESLDLLGTPGATEAGLGALLGALRDTGLPLPAGLLSVAAL
ncbi:uncharacterized protein LOC125708105 isoform X3 [Brienomyrus brachyistius]|uniref:uncharacterized protein LOC125708105 isoform X2 n=1 Tax=Brienomyrus brachyistius TaxID=42636 RepID=UPI0020B3890F|nr:uncharacterized protein LOC125708105 isoform X2 [Brienomyrus brachyistius]XP_048831582.1 uncharacterized protein LOC125708105 isoform X3 [Brienomyrus brachyistius]